MKKFLLTKLYPLLTNWLTSKYFPIGLFTFCGIMLLGVIINCRWLAFIGLSYMGGIAIELGIWIVLSIAQELGWNYDDEKVDKI